MRARMSDDFKVAYKRLKIYRVSETRLCFFVPAFQPVDASKYAKIKNTFLYICVFQKLFVILQRKM